MTPEDRIGRWRVRLSCGCVYPAVTERDDVHPAQVGHVDPATGRKLPAGEHWCWNDHEAPRLVYREIVEWVDRVVEELAPDPDEPDESWTRSPDEWQHVRDPNVRLCAIWGAKLTCGHIGAVHTDVRWAPEEGPLFASERVAMFRQAVKEAWASEELRGAPDDGSTRAHIARLAAQGWPWPEPEIECRACVSVRRVTGYRRVERRVPRARTATTSRLSRQQLVTRLEVAKRRILRLQRLLETSKSRFDT